MPENPEEFPEDYAKWNTPVHSQPGYEPSTEVQRWADVAMYSATPMADSDEPIEPRATVVNMTTNPLRTMAAACQLYRGDVVADPDEVPIAMASMWLKDMTKTTLRAGMEFIDLHFLIEGVSRALLDQARTQRTAVFVAESLRFSVKGNAAMEVMVPPSIAWLKDDDPTRVIWNRAVAQMSWAYNNLVNSGTPAEDARGLLPLDITTRFHYKTNLRNLYDHAGMRLCSQAQYEWKKLYAEIIKAIIEYGPESERWQQHAIANVLGPVCYHTGKCEFMAQTDRYCRIRYRVEEHHRKGEASDMWTDINPHELLLPDAAREAK
jgi:flavin-dependent thymidylate synthase